MQVLTRIFLLTVLFLSFHHNGSAQNDDEILQELEIFEKFGQVSTSDLQIDPDHTYPYEFLTKESTIRVEETSRGIIAFIDYLIRVKVFSDDPLSQAEASMVGIPYYFADGLEQVRHVEGITHNPDGSRTHLDLDQLRTVEINSRYRMIEFEMPDVEQGAILEYKYRIERRYIEELPDFYFSERVPVREANLYFKKPEFARYNAIEANADFDIQFNEHYIDTSSIPHVFTYQRPDPVYIQQWTAEKVPAVEVASYISSIDDIRAKIKFQISEFGIPRQPLENSWEFVKAQILRNNNPYEYIETFSYLERVGADIAAEKDDLVQVQDSVFQFVNENVQFDGQNAVFPQRGLAHVLNGNPANRAEINMALLALLRGAGIDASPMYLSGREFGRINKEFPSLYQFNQMIVFSTIDGERFFMDGAFSHSLPNLIATESYTNTGMILYTDDFEWLDITPDRSLFHMDISIDADLTRDGTLRGNLSATTRGYSSRQIRQSLDTGTPLSEIVSETFFDIYPEVMIENIQIEIDEEDRDIVRANARFEISEYAISFAEGLEFRPKAVGYLFANPFEAGDRSVPVTLDAPEFLSMNYTINLPQGFYFDVSGETRSTGLSGASLFEEYLADGNTIEYSFDINIQRKEFAADEYTQLREIYERWVSLSNDTWYIEEN